MRREGDGGKDLEERCPDVWAKTCMIPQKVKTDAAREGSTDQKGHRGVWGSSLVSDLGAGYHVVTS